MIQNEIPPANDLIEKDYQDIINKLKEEEELSRRKASSDYNNMVEYYTVWAHQIKTPIASMRLQIQSEDSELSRKLDGDLNRIEAYVEIIQRLLKAGVFDQHGLTPLNPWGSPAKVDADTTTKTTDSSSTEQTCKHKDCKTVDCIKALLTAFEDAVDEMNKD